MLITAHRAKQLNMKMLVACERFGAVRDAFRKRGFDAISCDTEETIYPGPHHKGYLEDFIGDGSEWAFIIAFPPCTYLCSSGLHWNGRTPGRQEKTEFALNFVAMIANKMRRAKYGGVLENPQGCISTRIGLRDAGYTVLEKSKSGFVPSNLFKPAQSIHPHEFGHDASKETCIWHVNTVSKIPLLHPTKHIEPRIVTIKGKSYKRWGNQTDSGQNRLGPSDDRATIRGRTYEGIADAMAEQWGNWLRKMESVQIDPIAQPGQQRFF